MVTGAQVVFKPVEEADKEEDPEQRIRWRACVGILRHGRNLQIPSFRASLVRDGDRSNHKLDTKHPLGQVVVRASEVEYGEIDG